MMHTVMNLHSANNVVADKDESEHLEYESTETMATKEFPARTDPALKFKLAVEEISSVADNSEPINCSDMIVEELIPENVEAKDEAIPLLKHKFRRQVPHKFRRQVPHKS